MAKKKHFGGFFPIFSNGAGWELLKIASNVVLDQPVHLARSDFKIFDWNTLFQKISEIFKLIAKQPLNASLPLAAFSISPGKKKCAKNTYSSQFLSSLSFPQWSQNSYEVVLSLFSIMCRAAKMK